IACHAQQVIMRGKLNASLRDQKAQVLQVRITIADQYIKDQPLVQAASRHRATATHFGQTRQHLDATLRIFEAAIHAQQLTGVNDMASLPSGLIDQSIKALNDVDWLRDVTSINTRHL